MPSTEPLTRPAAVKFKMVVLDVPAVRDFYTGVFGLYVVEEWNAPDDTGCILALTDPPGDALIEIYQGQQAHDFSGSCLQFKVADLDAFLRSLPEGICFEGPTERPWGSTYLKMSDPAGMPVVVFAGSSW
ncbi:VOC family protein [Sphingomonas arenae]|uniref:VOC family protein n=1 Tax=Sphingomonas arenae TaxID=2812555 RepID=UPI0019682325|nr:VOC family protein [Sphingomonas arenae]